MAALLGAYGLMLASGSGDMQIAIWHESRKELEEETQVRRGQSRQPELSNRWTAPAWRKQQVLVVVVQVAAAERSWSSPVQLQVPSDSEW